MRSLALALVSACFQTDGMWDIFDVIALLMLALGLVLWAIDADASLRPNA